MKFLQYIFLIIVLIVLALGVVCLGCGTLAGFLDAENFGEKAMLVDLFSHFRVQYLVGQLLLLLPLLLFCRVKNHLFRNAAICLAVLHLGFTGLNASQILPYYFPQPKNGPFIARFRVFHLNVLGKNRVMQPTIDAIKAANPDIITLQEYNVRWRQTLEASPVLKAYPYRFHIPWGDDAIYSRRPFIHISAEPIPGSPHGADVSIAAEMKFNSVPVTLLFSHPPTPIRKDLYLRQKRHFDFWIKNRKAYHKNMVLTGDLNISPWSVHFRQLMHGMGLKDSQAGFGVQPSFSTQDDIRRIPIDHCLVSEKFVVLNRQLGPNVHSDHFPVIIDLGLRKTNSG